MYEPVICASRGRNPDDPGDRTGSIKGKNVQMLEVGGPYSNTLTTVQKDNYVIEPNDVVQIGNIVDDTRIGFKNPQRGRIYDPKGVSPCLNCCGGGGLEPKILTPKRTEYGKQIRKQYERGQVNESRHNMTKLEPRTDGMANTLTTVQKDNLLIVYEK